jgi:crotonobetainyl-CoA:carnitine CoA-transferase CaiB-like acyl-CoA transferase
LFQKHDVLHAAVRDYTGVMNHPQALHLKMFQELEQAGVGTLPYMGLPSHPYHRKAQSSPRIGEHSVQVLMDYGLAKLEIEQLLAAGVVKQAGSASDAA